MTKKIGHEASFMPSQGKERTNPKTCNANLLSSASMRTLTIAMMAAGIASMPCIKANAQTACDESTSGPGVLYFNLGPGDMNINSDPSKIEGVLNGIFATNSIASTSTSLTTTGVVTGLANAGIYVKNSGTDLSINTGNCAVTGATIGIIAINDGDGTLSITTTGDVVGDTFGIIAENYGSDLTITTGPGAVTSNYIGISATNYGNDALTITTTGLIEGGTGDGISGFNYGTDLTITTGPSEVKGGGDGIDVKNFGVGALTVTTTGDVTGESLDGIYVENYGTDIYVTTGPGTVYGLTHGIHLNNYGTGHLILTANGDVISGTGDAILVNNDGTDLNITTTGAVTAGATGNGINANNEGINLTITTGPGAVYGGIHSIYAKNEGTGILTITTGDGDVTGADGDGINAENYGTDLNITTGPGAITGVNYGIYAENDGSGALTITTTGAVTSTVDDSIYATNSADGTDLTITTGAGAVSGGDNGIYAYNEGTGSLAVTTNIGAIRGETDDGIYAFNSSSSKDLEITTGDGTVSGDSNGIEAENWGRHLTIITGSGTISGDDEGINASNNGSGALSITTTGAVTGNFEEGIIARNSIEGTNLSITTGPGTISGYFEGIDAKNKGTGTLTINKGDGIVTSDEDDGIGALNYGTHLTITTGSGTVSGYDHGIHAQNFGTGALTITTGDGAVMGVDGNGIEASNIANGTDLTITTGAGTVSGDYSGIWARNSGTTGALTITTGDGNVTGVYGIGIDTRNSANGTDLTITTNAGAVSGDNQGVYAQNFGSGALTITTIGVVKGTYEEGINARNYGTDLTITTSGDVTGGAIGIETYNTGTGTTIININSSTVTGGTNQGIYAQTLSDSTNAITIATGAVVIAGASGIAVEETEGDATVTVAGTVTGDILTNGGSDTLILEAGGSFVGDAYLGGGDDTINLNGGMAGDILGGAGNDTAHWRGVTSIASLDLGLGDDTLTLYDGADPAAALGTVSGGDGIDSLSTIGDHTLDGLVTNFEVATIQDGTVSWNDTTVVLDSLTVSNTSFSFGGSVSGASSIDALSMLSGTGTFGGLTVDGIIAPGNSIGTITVSDDLTLGATSRFEAELFADGSSDLIDVASSAALDGGLTIDLVDAASNYDLDDIFTIIATGDGTTGDFATVTVEGGTTTLYARHEIVGNDVIVGLFDPTEYFSDQGETDNQSGAGGGLAGLAMETPSLFTANPSTVKNTLEQLSGNSHATMVNLLATDGNEYMNAALSEANGVMKGQFTTWMKFYGSKGTANSDGNARGYKYNGRGIAFGFGYGASEHLTVGVHGGLTWTDATFGTDVGEGRGKELGFYAAGQFEQIKMTALYSHGWHDVKMRRQIAMAGTALNDSDTTSNKFQMEASYPFQMDQLTIAPVIGYNYASIDSIALGESGAGVANLTGATRKFKSSQPRIGLRGSFNADLGVENGVLTPRAQVMYVSEQGDINGRFTADFDGAPNQNIDITGLSMDKTRLELDVGAHYRTKSNISLKIGYRGSYSRQVKTHGIRASLSIIW